MSYLIKQTHVILTCQQFRDIISILETICDPENDAYVRKDTAEQALRWLVEENLINPVDYGYPAPGTLPWERETAPG